MRKAVCIAAAALAAFFSLTLFSAAAYAAEKDVPEDVSITEEIPVPKDGPFIEDIPPAGPAADYPDTAAYTDTPPGTGTVIDFSADDGDGKLFYTIMTPDEYVFYLVVDRLRGQENVYFLNAVTIADLAALAEVSEPPESGTETEQAPAASEPIPAEPVPEAESGRNGGNTAMYIIIAALALLGGGALWYFRIYRPNRQGAASGGEYEPPADEADFADDWDDDRDEEDCDPPWDEDGEGWDKE